MVLQALSCSQTLFPPSRYQRLRPALGLPVFSSRDAVLYGVLPFTDSARLQQRGLVIFASQKVQAQGFGKKNVVPKKSASESPSTDSGKPRKGDVAKESQNMIAGEADIIPEAVMNRMMKRIAVSVAIPIGLAALSVPFFYYLRTVIGVDMPQWLPTAAFTSTFGTAGFALTYGILSTSWDPSQEGSLWGWKEAQLNWPSVWQNLKSKQEEDEDF